jgi:hypothetical protein
MDPTNSTPPPISENESEPLTPPQQELSEAQLREIYEAEEIERFLRLFDTVRVTQNLSMNVTNGYAHSMLKKSNSLMQRRHKYHKCRLIPIPNTQHK